MVTCESRNYIAMYNSKKMRVKANSSYQAQKAAIDWFKPPKSKEHMVHVYLADSEINTGSL